MKRSALPCLITALLCSPSCLTNAAPKALPSKTIAADAMEAAVTELVPESTPDSFQTWLKQLPGFQFSPATARLLKQEFGGTPLFTVSTSNAEDGANVYTIAVPARHHTSRAGKKYAWSTMQARLALQASDGTVVSEGHAPKLSVQSKDGRMILEDLAFSSNGRSGDSGFYNGKFNGAIGKMTVATATTRGVSTLQKLYLNFSIDEQPSTLGMRYEAGIGAMRLGGLQLDNILMAAHVDNMDKASLQLFRQMSAALASQSSDAGAGHASTMKPLWDKLLSSLASKGAVVTLDNFQIGYKGNIARINGFYRFDNMQPEDFGNPKIMQKKLVSHVEARVPLAMVRAVSMALGGRVPKPLPRRAGTTAIGDANLRYVNEILAGPIAAGLLRIDGDMLISAVDMRDGMVLMNGKPMMPPINDDEDKTPIAAVDTRISRTRLGQPLRVADKCGVPDFMLDDTGVNTASAMGCA